MKNRITKITISLLAFCTLTVDYTVTREFLGEDVFYFALALLLFSNIARKLIGGKSVPVTIIMSLTIMITAMCCFGYLLFIGWGNAYSGRATQPIWIIGLVVDFALGIEALLELATAISSGSNNTARKH